MKKIISLLACLAIVSTASAVPLSFKFAYPDQFMFGSTLLTSHPVTMYYADGTFAKTQNTTGGLPIPALNGKITEFTFTFNVDSPNYATLSEDFYLLTQYTSGGKTYSNYSALFTATGWANGTTVPEISSEISFDFANIYDLAATYGVGGDYDTYDQALAALTSKAASTGGWNSFTITPVPEPATAGLAFAGLALLFRRKRK